MDGWYVDVSRFHMNKHEKLLQQLCQVRITFYFSSLTPNQEIVHSVCLVLPVMEVKTS